MEMNQVSNRIHPLLAGAAASVMLVSLLGAAAIAGILPNSHGSDAETMRTAARTAGGVPALAPTQSALPASPQFAVAPAVTNEAKAHKTVVHHQYAQHQAKPVQHYSSAPAYQQPAPVAKYSPLGIGVGAVVGGLLGNQVGGGNGRTLATIAGAVGGGYVGNEVARRNQ
jgi:uncharacterized protein YcfJ